MSVKADHLRKGFAPMLDKSLKNALAHQIARQFPRIGGERIRTLCAEVILETVNAHLRPQAMVGHGQVLWLAVSLDDPPARRKRMRDTDLVPVILDLSTEADVQAILDREPVQVRLRRRAIRLSEQAYAQGALLSNVDLALLLNRADSQIASLLAAYERQTGQVIPRRATLHDCGTGTTHKAIICRKRYVEGKSADQIARETHHSLKAVDTYLSDFDRVRQCRRIGMTIEQMAFTLNHSQNLIRQYIVLDDELSPSIIKGEEVSNG